MIPNPFLQQIGPQVEGPPVAQQIDPQAAQYNAMLRARELQARADIANLVRGQQTSNLAGAVQLGAGQAGKYLGTTISGSTAATLGASSAPAATSTTTTASTAPAAAGGGSSVLGTVGTGLGVLATAYGTYQSNKRATQSIQDLHDAIAGGNLTPEQEADARQKVFNAGMVSQGIGGVGGLLGGASFGPVGMVAGGILGSSGGARQAWGSYDNNQDRVKAMETFVRNPFKR